jgi:hypothetical protein
VPVNLLECQPLDLWTSPNYLTFLTPTLLEGRGHDCHFPFQLGKLSWDGEGKAQLKLRPWDSKACTQNHNFGNCLSLAGVT